MTIEEQRALEACRDALIPINARFDLEVAEGRTIFPGAAWRSDIKRALWMATHALEMNRTAHKAPR